MKILRLLLCTLAILLSVPSLPAQETTPTQAPATERIDFGTLKVKIVLTESDGQKLISSLPYTVPISLNEQHSDRGFLRIGVRVPIEAAAKTGENSSITYLDVGTNIDCVLQSARGRFLMDQSSGSYLLSISVERSSLYVPIRNADGKIEGREWKQGDLPPGTQPVIRDFRGNFVVTVREGQASEMTVATDPVTGHILKAEVSATVTK